MKRQYFNSPRFTALSDIAKEIREGESYKENTYVDEFRRWDVWNVTWEYLDTKQNRRLNRYLGIWSINKFKK